MPQELDAAAQREIYNRLYTNPDASFRNEPNAFLVRIAVGRKPGNALDIGMGEGRNAAWLAREGWTVTGFDISDAALARVRQRGIRGTFTRADADTYDYGLARWDLVCGFYLQAILTRNAAKIVASLKPGGWLVAEGFHEDRLTPLGRTGSHRTNELLHAFAALRIRLYEDRFDAGDWAPVSGPQPIVRIFASLP